MTDGHTTAPATAARPDGPAVTGVEVTAVVVTRGLSEYLEQTLEALATQVRSPRRVILVDADPHGPDTALGELVAARFSAGPPEPIGATVVTVPQAHTFGEAVHRGLDQAAHEAGGWLWLLHDDSAPEPEALAELLRAVELAPSVAVAGCKQRTWSEPPRVLEVGITTSRFGRRMTGIDEPELDQGQHDGREDVLGVGIAGALVRRDVWDELGGTDPALGPYGDGLDLSRRARLAGHRVVVVPSAAVRHAQASLAQPFAGAVLNRPGWDVRRSAQARREAYLHGQLAGVPLGLVPLVAVLAVLSGLARALGRLVIKEPHLVLAELVAPWAVLLRPVRVVKARRRAAATRRLRRGSLRPLQVTWRDVWRQARDRRLAAAELRRARQAPSELELAELRALRSRRRGVLAGVLLMSVAVSALTLGPLVARVVAGARLTGGTLVAGEAGLGELWAMAVGGWVPSGLGHAGPTDPLLLALLPVTAVTGTVGRAAALLLLGSVVLSALGAWFAAGAATRSTVLRAWASLVWAASPALLLAVGDVRLGAVVAHVGLPWVVLGIARGLGVARIDSVESGLVGAQRQTVTREAEVLRPTTAEASLAATAGAGLAFALVSAAAPVLLPAGLLALVAVAVAARRRRRLLWVALPALAVHAPMLVGALQESAWWRALVADPGLPVASVAAPAWQQLLGWPVEPPPWMHASWVPADVSAVLPLVATGLVVVLAAVALSRSGPRGRAVRAGWVVAACGLLAAAVASRVEVGVADAVGADGAGLGEAGLGTVLATAWQGSGLSLALVGLLAAAVPGADGLREAMARHSFGWRQLTAGVVAVLAVAGPALTLGAWTWAARDLGTDAAATHVAVPTAVRASDVPDVPAVGRQIQTSADAARVLSLRMDADGRVAATVLRGDGVQLTELSRAVTARGVEGLPGQGTPAEADAADLELAEAAALLATGSGEDVARRLATLGIGAVVVPPVEAAEGRGAWAALVGRLDSTLALERMTETDAGIIWRVAATEVGTTSAWARLVDAEGGVDGAGATAVPAQGGRIDTVVPDGVSRLLVLAERSDDGWRAWLDGRPLRTVETSWQQAFEMGESGGRLTVAYAPVSRTPWLVVQGAVLLATALLALPVRRRRGAPR